MTKLQDALTYLRPKDFAEIPLETLNVYLRDIFAQAELIANSVPPPPGGTDFLSSSRIRRDVNGASKASEITNSPVRPPPPDPDHEGLREAWGKPVKLSARDNPLGIAVYKMAGHDRHGAWFARRSVHEGLSFSKWKRAMQSEFPESLAVRGGPGEGNVRGIGGDKRLERRTVGGVGRMEVYQLSAKFPPPTSPREFITLLLTSDCCLTDASTPHVDSRNASKATPRHWMVVSIPVSHPDAPPRDGLIRGSYESVELLREIPLTTLSSDSTTDSTIDCTNHGRNSYELRDSGNAIGLAASRGPKVKGEPEGIHANSDVNDPETNPVEWIMVTRSDPGGGIPRFMVERNTPSSIAADAVKFLDWACSKDEFISEEEATEDKKQSVDGQESSHRHSLVEANASLAGVGTSIVDRPAQSADRQTDGILSSLASTTGTSIASSVQEPLPAPLNPLDSPDEDDSSDTSSIASYASAEEDFHSTYDARPGSMSSTSAHAAIGPGGSTDVVSSSSLSLDSKILSKTTSSDSGAHTHEKMGLERELARLDAKRQQLDERLAGAKEKVAAKAKETAAKEEKEAERMKARYEREMRRHEEKYAKEIERLRRKREKEEEKIEHRKQKERQKKDLASARRERDKALEQVRHLKAELEDVRVQVGVLQRENTALTSKMGETESGRKILKEIKNELGNLGRRGRSVEKRAAGGQA